MILISESGLPVRSFPKNMPWAPLSPNEIRKISMSKCIPSVDVANRDPKLRVKLLESVLTSHFSPRNVWCKFCIKHRKLCSRSSVAHDLLGP